MLFTGHKGTSGKSALARRTESSTRLANIAVSDKFLAPATAPKARSTAFYVMPGEPEIAIGHEPRIEPWLPVSTSLLAALLKLDGIVTSSRETHDQFSIAAFQEFTQCVRIQASAKSLNQIRLVSGVSGTDRTSWFSSIGAWCHSVAPVTMA
jgi:hypothetical protein